MLEPEATRFATVPLLHIVWEAEPVGADGIPKATVTTSRVALSQLLIV
jgi:hypothetical protein